LQGALWHVRVAWALSFISAALIAYGLGIHGLAAALAILIGTPVAFILVQALAVFTAAPGLDRFPEDKRKTGGNMD
jgi:hypothetical protein